MIEALLEIQHKKFFFDPNTYSKGAPDASSSSQGSNLVDDDTGLRNTWIPGQDYFRIDGAVAGELRKKTIDKFNDPKNPRGRLFLLSTKAGSLGINLVGANRCIIFDASWNPTHDVQAIFRIYRFGQLKPCYVYRFVCKGTMEERIYDRQIIKQSLAARVVDEHQILRHFKEDEVSELYKFEPEPQDVETPNVPKDRLLADILHTDSTKHLIITYHEHDSLLENKPEENLSEEEKQEAWNLYEQEKEMGAQNFIQQQQQAQLQQQQQQQQQQQNYQQQMPQFIPTGMSGFDDMIRRMAYGGASTSTTTNAAPGSYEAFNRILSQQMQQRRQQQQQPQASTSSGHEAHSRTTTNVPLTEPNPINFTLQEVWLYILKLQGLDANPLTPTQTNDAYRMTQKYLSQVYLSIETRLRVLSGNPGPRDPEEINRFNAAKTNVSRVYIELNTLIQQRQNEIQQMQQQLQERQVQQEVNRIHQQIDEVD